MFPFDDVRLERRQNPRQEPEGSWLDLVTEQCGHHSATFPEAWVTLPVKGFTISISVSDSLVCPGGDPEAAAQIQGSIHAV